MIRATVRLQLHAGFTLDAAGAQLDYYDALGISHLYLSPVARARCGSTHGYDVIDHAQVNPELGGLAALRRLASTGAPPAGPCAAGCCCPCSPAARAPRW
ncbi:alpha-amylase family glycosyl hydrolase, partial [Bordetella pertussis]|uniref:alpha-amylase family glycosyl hydrolase n=1 Tax=Bordetella pertussis TaxID=520 RepID=UPI000A468F67